jgi:hypothetical protein
MEEKLYMTVHCRVCQESIEAEIVDSGNGVRKMMVNTIHACEVIHDGRRIELPLDYEKALKEANNKLQHHVERAGYHKAMVTAMEDHVEELIPFTGHEERVAQRNKEQLESSKEFTEKRKKVKKQSALAMVDSMLRQLAESDV